MNTELDLLERCATIALQQPHFADTKVGKRQQWVKEEIAEKILALGWPNSMQRLMQLKEKLAKAGT